MKCAACPEDSPAVDHCSVGSVTTQFHGALVACQSGHLDCIPSSFQLAGDSNKIIHLSFHLYFSSNAIATSSFALP